MALHGSLLFHLNLSYSSIEVARRRDVVRRCYAPMLGLLEGRPWLKLTVEAGAHTLERIAELDPAWLERLRGHLDAGRVELVGSGDTQLIGPLVPASVHARNQALGMEGYAALTGVRPTVALVNEMAWSQGIVDGYADAGYEALLMEWNNPRREHPEWRNAWRFEPAWTESPGGRRLALLWVDAIAFQKFQRAVVGDVELDEYRGWLAEQRAAEPRHVFLYASDAEVFDFRPGRYASEPAIDARGEWRRMGELLDALHADQVAFTTPREHLARAVPPAERCLTLTSGADPIPVKKQPKYNVTRWALSGWDDVGLNAACHARARELEHAGGDDDDWRDLCRAWSSDHRTHLTPARWALLERPTADPVPPPADPPPLAHARVARDGRRLVLETDALELVLDARRGLAVQRLGWRGGDGAAGAKLIGTLPHGYFDDIDWAADFYSGHSVLEMPARARVTDLEAVEPAVERRERWIEVTAEVDTPLGPLPKRVRACADRVELDYGFSSWGKRPVGSLRTAVVTLDPETFAHGELWVRCAQGGAPERFALDRPCDHGGSVSTLISARAAFGATDGTLEIGNGDNALRLSWSPEVTAALPLLTFREVDGRRMCRLAFSLAEVDDTHREGAPLRDFRVTLQPFRLRP